MSEPDGGREPSRQEVARLLSDIGTLLELKGEEGFRVRAFTQGARALEGSDADLAALARAGRLTSLRGVGAGLAAVISEYVLSGRSTLRDELLASTPLGLYDLLRVPGLGPKRIHTLHAMLGVEGLDTLEAAIQAGRVRDLPGFGPKTETRLREGLAFARASGQRRRYPDALLTAAALHGWFEDHPEVERAEIAGQVRRFAEVVDRIDLVAAAERPEEVLRAFRETHGDPEDALPGGEDAVTVRLSDGMLARLRCVPPGEFGGALAWETGSEGHLAALAALAAERGGSLGAGGLVLGGARVALRREEDLYAALGLAVVPAELREDADGVERAARGPLPRLVEEGDLTGTFHCHTTDSDGKATLEEIAAAARERGWSYLGIADHSRAAAYARGMPESRVREQQSRIVALNAGFARDGGAPFRLFKGIESDILPDGSLDYTDDLLRTFDYVVGSVHSSFGMGRAEMTERVVRAVHSPHLTILGHPTGRLLLRREGYALDIAAVIAAAAETGAAIEINAHPHRIDLDWRHVRAAAAAGVLIAINPDAHSVAALDHVTYGIHVARRAGLQPREVLNTWPLDEVVDYFARRRQVQPVI